MIKFIHVLDISAICSSTNHQILTKSKPAMIFGKFLCSVIASSTVFTASVAFIPLRATGNDFYSFRSS